jgi:hypothetical protein
MDLVHASGGPSQLIHPEESRVICNHLGPRINSLQYSYNVPKLLSKLVHLPPVPYLVLARWTTLSEVQKAYNSNGVCTSRQIHKVHPENIESSSMYNYP